jgi:hypothetical protein
MHSKRRMSVPQAPRLFRVAFTSLPPYQTVFSFADTPQIDHIGSSICSNLAFLARLALRTTKHVSVNHVTHCFPKNYAASAGLFSIFRLLVLVLNARAGLPHKAGGCPVTGVRSKPLARLVLPRTRHRRRGDDRGDGLCANRSNSVGTPLPNGRVHRDERIAGLRLACAYHTNAANDLHAASASAVACHRNRSRPGVGDKILKSAR